MLSRSGYFMGERLYRARGANPKGFFESPDVNGVNEDLLGRVIPGRPPLIGRWFFRERPARRQRWLARVPLDATIPSTRGLSKRISGLVARQPFCFKDPRFCYTLPVWRPFLSNVVFVCVFRHPAATVTSILKECATAPYLSTLSMNFERALEVWSLMYQHVLRIHIREGDWLFVHYDQLLSKTGFALLEDRLDVRVDRDFPDPTLRRSKPEGEIPGAVEQLYSELCALAGWEPHAEGVDPPDVDNQSAAKDANQA